LEEIAKCGTSLFIFATSSVGTSKSQEFVAQAREKPLTNL